MLGAGALAVLVVAVALSLRPGSDPVAAQQPTPMPPPAPASAGPAVARLGNQQIDLAELKSVLASLPAESREQLRANRGALEPGCARAWRKRPCSNRPTPRLAATPGGGATDPRRR
jgi:peptidylprolyl isomerase